MNPAPTVELQAGRDYLLENGLYVWTASYLQNRGYCCGNACRNCPYIFSNTKKVISLVPSWTQTLIECDIEVLGRTRFCIHPEDKVSSIAIMGGTKTIKADRIKASTADLVLLDKQENPREFMQDIDKAVYVSDVDSLETLFREMIELNKILLSAGLNRLIIKLEGLIKRTAAPRTLARLPGVLEWLRAPQNEIETLLYIIWREPWMCVSQETFIASMLSHLGYGALLPGFASAYPEICLQDYDPERTLLLFSTEPFPFHKKRDALSALGFPAAIVDGEAYSWFGSRAVDFLAAHKYVP